MRTALRCILQTALRCILQTALRCILRTALRCILRTALRCILRTALRCILRTALRCILRTALRCILRIASRCILRTASRCILRTARWILRTAVDEMHGLSYLTLRHSGKALTHFLAKSSLPSARGTERPRKPRPNAVTHPTPGRCSGFFAQTGTAFPLERTAAITAKKSARNRIAPLFRLEFKTLCPQPMLCACGSYA